MRHPRTLLGFGAAIGILVLSACASGPDSETDHLAYHGNAYNNLMGEQDLGQLGDVPMNYLPNGLGGL